MLSVITSCALAGLEAYPVTIEVDLAPGLPGFTMVGLPDSAVRESRERVFAALKNSGFSIPSRRITVNLAPGGVRKEGTAFDLALALGLLLASEQVELPSPERILFLGELSLDGGLRPVRGALPAALLAKASGLAGLIVPRENGPEASLVPELPVHPLGSLRETLDFLREARRRSPATRAPSQKPREPEADLAEVKGQEQAKRALEVAAAGGHHFLMVGTPGCGKTMLARRLPSILPPMSEAEVLETTRIYSVAGLFQPRAGLLRSRPFRSPHHSISTMALLGGGGAGRPGELSLAHNGVLFLDELPEFRRDAVEALRQPLEAGHVTVSRVGQSLDFPCRVMLGAAMNPCPCGRLGDPNLACRCRMEEIARYRARVSGPILDRIDIHLEMGGLSYGEVCGNTGAESSSAVRDRVLAARAIQRRRFGDPEEDGGEGRGDGNPGGDALPSATARAIPAAGIRCNAQMTSALLARHCVLDTEGRALMKDALVSLGLSARAHDRILRVARTIADLEDSADIRADHVAEAIHYRLLDRQRHALP